MSWGSRHESKDFSSLSEREKKEMLRTGKVPELTNQDKKDRKDFEKFMKALEKKNDGRKHPDLRGTASGLRDLTKGKPTSRVSGKMPNGPVNRDGTPRKSWW